MARGDDEVSAVMALFLWLLISYAAMVLSILVAALLLLLPLELVGRGLVHAVSGRVDRASPFLLGGFHLLLIPAFAVAGALALDELPIRPFGTYAAGPLESAIALNVKGRVRPSRPHYRRSRCTGITGRGARMGQGDTSTALLLDGRYLLGDRVGSGGMATVYRAEDTHLERTVAIKMLRDDDDAVVDAADRAHTEKALLASVSHPSLVTLFDARLEPGRSRYLVMEFVDGPTLSAQLSSGPLPASQVARLACDLAEALATVHSAGIVHRDVKPSNVLLGPAGGGRRVAKLADFGIACSVDSPRATSPGMVLGTLAYMAPEQVRGEDPTPAVDVFSLGLVLLEALTGRSGYPVSAAVASAVARLTMHPEIPDAVDDEWRRLIEWMTRLDPAERATAQDVADAARRLLPAPDRAPRGIAVPAPVPASALVAAAPVEPSRPVTAPTAVAPPASATTSAAVSGPVAPTPADAHRATTGQSPLPRREGHGAARRVRARRGRRLLISLAAALVLGIGIAGGATMLSGGGGSTVDAVSGAIVEVTPTTVPAPAAETPEVPETPVTEEVVTEEVVTEEDVTEEQSPVEPVVTPAEPQTKDQTTDEPSDRSDEASQNQGPPSFSNGNKGDDSSKKDDSSKGKKD